MNPVQYQAMPPPQQWGPSIPAQSPPQQWGPSIPAQSPPQQWGPLIPVQPPPQQWGQSIPAKPPTTSFWNHLNIQHHLRDLQETLCLANSLQKELEMLMKVKEAKGYMGKGDDVVNGSTGSLKFDEFSNHFEDNKIDLGAQELIAVEAVNGLMSKIRFLLEPFRIVTDDGSPWEEKSAVVRLRDKINKSKRNKLWRKKKRRRVAELLAQDGEKYEKLNRVADEWRAREIAKDMAQQKVEKMKEIAKQKAKEERKKLEAERELALMVEKLQELRSIRIQKLKKQGHFLPEEDDKFLERVRAAAEEEERQAKAAADTDAAKDAIAAAEESRIVTQGSKLDLKDENHKEDGEESQTRNNLGSLASTSKEFEKQGCDGQSYGTYDYVANLPPEFYHYYHGSNADMGTLIEVRRTWDAYIRPGGSRIPSHWVQPPPPADEVWASSSCAALMRHR